MLRNLVCWFDNAAYTSAKLTNILTIHVYYELQTFLIFYVQYTKIDHDRELSHGPH